MQKKIEECIEELIKLLSEVELVSDKIDINKLVDQIFVDHKNFINVGSVGSIDRVNNVDNISNREHKRRRI